MPAVRVTRLLLPTIISVWALPMTGLNAQRTDPTAPAVPFSESAVANGKRATPASAYATDMGVDVDEARARLRLQDEATQYAATLMAENPTGFVEMELQHKPTFKVVLYYQKSIDRELLTRSAPVTLRKYLVFNPINKSREQILQNRQAINAALNAAGLRYGLEFSLRSGKFKLQIPEQADEASYLAVLPSTISSDLTIIRGPMAEDIDALYGGWWFTAGGVCTAGWPIRNSAGQEALLTAGHCGPPHQMYFSWREGPTLSPPSVQVEGDNGWQTTDYAMYPLGPHTTTRVIYVQNDTQYNGYTNRVPGIITTYYEITHPRQTANGQYVCKNGGRTGITCGTVVDKNFSDSNNKNLVKVSQSSQPYIAEGGDSGGPVFAWSADGSMVHPVGIMKATARNTDGTACRNVTSTASSNTTCFFVFTPLTTIRAYSPFTVNTTAGFVAP